MEEILASIRRIISDDDKPEEATSEAEQATPEVKSADLQQTEPGVDGMNAEPVLEAVDDETTKEDTDIFELTDVAPEEAGEAGDQEAEAEPEVDSVAAAEESAAEVVDETSDGLEEFDGDLDFVDPGENDDEMAATDAAPVEDPAPDEPFPAADEPAAEEVVVAEVSADEPMTGAMLSISADEATSSAFKALAETLVAQKGSSRTLEDLLEDLLRPMLKSWLDKNLPELTDRLVRDEIERITRRGGY